jgi:antitoxin HicB
MRFAYPYELTAQPEGGFTVTFPDVPEAITQGETEKEAAAMAEDALVTALSFYTDDGEPLPLPSPANGRSLAHVPPLVAVKLALHSAMLATRVSNVALARRLGVDEKIVRRLRDPLHKSRMDQLDEALRALGKRIEIEVSGAAEMQDGAIYRESSSARPRRGNVVEFPRQKSCNKRAAGVCREIGSAPPPPANPAEIRGKQVRRRIHGAAGIQTSRA